MNSIPIQDDWFDDAATLTMGKAFDHACKSLHRFKILIPAREMIAKRIIDAAKNGERDPARLYEHALVPFEIDNRSTLVVRVSREPVRAAYTTVAHAA